MPIIIHDMTVTAKQKIKNIWSMDLSETLRRRRARIGLLSKKTFQVTFHFIQVLHRYLSNEEIITKANGLILKAW